MDPREIARQVLAENGNWMVSQMGADGLHDLIWDIYPPYQRMTIAQQCRVRAEVEEVIFG